MTSAASRIECIGPISSLGSTPASIPSPSDLVPEETGNALSVRRAIFFNVSGCACGPIARQGRPSGPAQQQRLAVFADRANSSWN